MAAALLQELEQAYQNQQVVNPGSQPQTFSSIAENAPSRFGIRLFKIKDYMDLLLFGEVDQPQAPSEPPAPDQPEATPTPQP